MLVLAVFLLRISPVRYILQVVESYVRVVVVVVKKVVAVGTVVFIDLVVSNVLVFGATGYLEEHKL